MSVAELIKLLQQCDPKKDVVIYDCCCEDWFPVDSVKEEDNDVKLNFD